ncbi:hypothetical protein [Aquimarina pacifica]|uniref:hypothetical protein n=1 Tax=Aquimarina pacifica TaxID=1296415 RepID=UPI0004729DE7|nr:hypothetical protein [Aquimarina pacifica]
MKTALFSLITIFLVSFSFGQELNSSKIIEIPASYADRIGTPEMVRKDSLYIFRTGDIFLVNKMSLSAMKKIYEEFSNQNDMTKTLVDNYTNTLKRNIELENKLKINFAKNDSLDQKIYERTQATLINTQRALDYTINSLEKATNSLDLVEKNVKRQRRKSIFEKALIAIGGVGVGVLVGVSL